MEQNKKFDAVKMMREIREKLSEKYWKHPDILKKEMQEIKEKHNLKFTEFVTTVALDTDVRCFGNRHAQRHTK